ncbi:hypothetical protein M378DRAFT_180985 [Amanita muscaria Koide BX008]|uniref:Uncharacterized protein n=1 Tax=Amanita muscaria (strain Koide BX008) TaxID=946122 RepID=A0A0C2WCP0_AMAMK|nr:hypothetical protein M378DRAFT_180985 [Amanita muscaria Koide BX008]
MSEPRQPKKRKFSSLSGLELQLAYNAVFKLKETFSYVESVNPEGALVPNDDFDQRVLEILAIFEARMKVPQSLSFSNVDNDNLSKLNITFAGSISLKSDLDERIATTSSLKEDDLWSSNNLYRQLNVLESLVARSTEAGARAWIDAFFFRATAMLSSDKRMVLTMEYAVPSVNIGPSNRNISGLIDYAAIVANKKDARIFRQDSRLLTIKRNMGDSTGLFVVQAKLHDPANHIPQAVAEFFACAKHLDKQVVRGALTNGREWIFLLVKLNDDRNGASFMQSDIIHLNTQQEGLSGPQVMIRPFPDLIAGILSHWMQNSLVELASDDWFEVEA